MVTDPLFAESKIEDTDLTLLVPFVGSNSIQSSVERLRQIRSSGKTEQDILDTLQQSKLLNYRVSQIQYKLGGVGSDVSKVTPEILIELSDCATLASLVLDAFSHLVSTTSVRPYLDRHETGNVSSSIMSAPRVIKYFIEKFNPTTPGEYSLEELQERLTRLKIPLVMLNSTLDSSILLFTTDSSELAPLGDFIFDKVQSFSALPIKYTFGNIEELWFLNEVFLHSLLHL